MAENVVRGGVHKPRDEKKFEVGRECACWEMEDACEKCKDLAKNLMPNTTIRFYKGGGK